MFLPVLQVLTAPIAIDGPIAAPLPVERLGAVRTPTLAARALSVDGLAGLPAAQAVATLQCLVRDDGTTGECVEAADGGTGVAQIFWSRLRPTLASADPVSRAALARAAYYRFRPRQSGTAAMRTVLIREPVSASDAVVLAPPVAVVAPTALRMASPPDLAPFYPEAAVTRGAQTRVTATCRVLGDRSLLCRDARTDLVDAPDPSPPWRDPAHDDAFERATPRALAAVVVSPRLDDGRSAVGRETRLGLRWTVAD